MMVPTNETPSPDLEPSLVRLRAEIVGTTNVHMTTNDNLSDIFFICGDDFYPIQCHRVILRNWSSFFAKAVDSSLSIKGPFPVAPFIVLKEVCGKDLQDIFKFIYNGDLVIERSRIGSLLRTARFLEINQLPDLLEASEELRDDINNFNENTKDSIASIKSSEGTVLNSDAVSKCSEATIINSDTTSKSSGRASNNSIENSKISDEGSDVFDVNASSNVPMSPVNEENFAETVEQNKASNPNGNGNSFNENSSNETSSNSQTKSLSPTSSFEERLRKQTLFFSSIFGLPRAIEPAPALKAEKSPTQPKQEVEEIDLTD